MKKDLIMQLLVENEVLCTLKGHVGLTGGESIGLQTKIGWYEFGGHVPISAMDNARTIGETQTVLLAHYERMYAGKEYGISWNVVPRGSLDNPKTKKYRARK